MPGPINAAKTSFEIIEILRERDGAGVSEVAKRLDRPTSTVHDYLQTLESEQYLVKRDGEYHVGIRFLQLGEQARAQREPFEVARPEVDDLAAETGEHANLMIEEHGLGVFLYKARGDKAVQLDTHAGMQVPLQTAALGKSIMAHRPPEEVEAILNRHGMPAITDHTITDREELFDALGGIRERGYAYDNQERVKGMRCVAAPITNDEGRAIAAVSVSSPKSRMREERFTEEIPESVLRTSNVIEVNLVYS